MKIALLSFERPLQVLLSGILFTHLGYYLILPVLAIILTTEKGLTISQVGTVLGTGSISYLAGSLLGGWLSDRIGQRRTLVIGLFMRGIGLLGFGVVAALPYYYATSIVSGVGGGIYTPPAKSGIASFASEQNKSTAFSYRGIAANIGVTVGPLIGAIFTRGSSVVLFVIASLIYGGLAVVHQFLLPADCKKPPCQNQLPHMATNIWKDRSYLIFSLVTILIWALYTQFTFSIPLRAAEILANPKGVSLLWSFTSIMVIFLQAPLTRFTSGVFHPLLILSLGSLLMGVGLGSIMWSSMFFHLFMSITIFTIGEMLIMPTVDTIVSQLAKPQMMGTYFGIAALVWGVGEALGNFGGGQLMNLARSLGTPSLPWIIFAITGGLLGLILFSLQSWHALADPLSGSLIKRSENLPRLSIKPTLFRKRKKAE